MHRRPSAGRRERGHDLDALKTGLDDLVGHLLGDEITGTDEQFGRAERVVNVVAGATAHDALLEADHFVVTLIDCLLPDTITRAAILVGDDHIHGHVAKLTGEITGIGGFQCGIRETLTGAMG